MVHSMKVKVLKNKSGILSGLAALKSLTVLSSGRTVTETEEEAQKITDELYADAFRKGIPMFYKDDRSKALTQFIRADPNGSEDLVDFDVTKGEYTIIKNLL
jgi:hypothetical protein